MNFLVDAQLPRRLAEWLRDRGHDACHTLDLAKGNRTSDAELCMLAANEDRIVVTKELVKKFVASAARLGEAGAQPPECI